MSWQDWGDVRHQSRGKKSDLFSHKNPNVKWTSGDATEVDSRAAAKNHRKAMEEQRKVEALARRKADIKAKQEKEKWEKKQAKKAAKKAARKP